MKKDPLNYFLGEVRECGSHPRSVVLVAHEIIELIVNLLVKNHCNNGKRIIEDTRSYTHASKCVILNELKVLHDDELKLLDRFRKLRNDLVHDVNVEIDNGRIKNVIGDWQISLSYNKSSSSKEFKGNVILLCITIVSQIWGSNMEELNELFALGKQA